MLTKFATVLSLAAVATSAATALSVPTGTWPTSTGTVKSDKAIVVAAGTTFDGKMQTYERSDITCQGQKESSAKDAMFIVEAGATLKNVIVGKNQMEGVHCDSHDCTIENVWWDDVCEDALSVKGGTASSVTNVIGGGARNADDKVIQHNGLGTVKIDGFFADTFGKLYRSCGTCGAKQRNVEISNVLAKNPKVSIVTVNSDNNDKATLKNIYVESTKSKVTVCGKTTTAKSSSSEPTKAGDGADGKVCIYSESDIHINGKAPSGGSAASNSTSGSGGSNTKPTPVSTQKPTKTPKTKTPKPKSTKDDTVGGEGDADPTPSSSKADDVASPAPTKYEPGTVAPGVGNSSTPATGTVPTGTWPTSTGTVKSDKAIVVAAGTTFDGKMQTYERSDITCQGQKESSAKDAMFIVEAGATLKNVIVGKNQMEGVHCDSHDCTIENVWWDDVCEDALSVKGGTASSVTKVIGGGARNADDKVWPALAPAYSL